jgi:hypothetical protein
MTGNPLNYLLTFGCGLAACFGLQTAFLHHSHGRSVKSESNFFSTVARLQAATRDSPQVLLLGSSMTGRLPDRSRGFPGVANMGCDGGSAVETLQAIDRGDLPAAPLIIVEGNTLQHGFEMTSSQVADAVTTWSFREGARFPAFGASGRPSALVYSTLMERKLGGPSATGLEPLHPVTRLGLTDPQPQVKAEPLHEQSRISALAAVAGRLKEKGSRLVVVMLPTGSVSPGSFLVAQEFARQAAVPFWDLGGGIAKDDVQLSDDVHMTPASAAATMKTLMLELDR